MVYEELYRFDDGIRARRGVMCGADEAGRGPLAGPVSCAAVILKPGVRFDGLTDSKKVSEKNRERLYDEIVSRCEAYSCVLIDNETIDRVNILIASLTGMARAIETLGTTPAFALIDGNKIPKCAVECEAVTKGDSRSASIAAASIIAKVTRDRFMIKLAEKYPQYGFEKHKGYPTKAHYEAIRAYGVTPFHRTTFLKVVV